jgi:dihydrofolate reductase
MEMIVATDEKGGIAKNGKIPWFVPQDLKFFQNKTKHNIVVMGKKTFLSLPHGPLKNRLNIVLTREPIVSQTPSVIFTQDMDWIQQFEPSCTEYPFLQENCKKFIIGGAEIYRQYISQCAVLWLTTIRGDYECDVFFTPLLNEGRLNEGRLNEGRLNEGVRMHSRESLVVEEGEEYCIQKIDLKQYKNK